MKIDARRLYTYPVLAEGRDDYKTCTFTAELDCCADAANNLVLDVKIFADCADLKRLVALGAAEYILHVECPPTSCREIFSSAAENFSGKIPVNRLKNYAECMVLVALTKDIKNFSCADWNDDFAGLTFDLPKGSVLAYQNFKPLMIPDDPNEFKNVSSIFSVHKKIEDNEPCNVELNPDKIKVALNAKDYELYRRHCIKPEMQPILNAIIILPALICVFDELKREEALDHSTDKWYLSLQAAFKRRGLNFAELLFAEDSFKLAQQVMHLPITKALENISLAFDEAPEDS